MSVPTVFLSAASVDLREWREALDGAFRRGGFRVLTQDKSLRSAPGDVKRLLVETIAECDCIIHLAGFGYGSDATDPFPSQPDFQCSQFPPTYAPKGARKLRLCNLCRQFNRRADANVAKLDHGAVILKSQESTDRAKGQQR